MLWLKFGCFNILYRWKININLITFSNDKLILIQFQRILGKYFETLALDIQVVSEGKIKQSWHIEDWSTALDQALYGKPIPDFGLDDAYITY